jgi:diguanylate cyclase (GGDEF)-like protein
VSLPEVGWRQALPQSGGIERAVLDRLGSAVWVFDIDQRRIHWANPAALKLWRAPDLESLQARDLGRDMSASVAERLAQYQQDFIDHDARFHELWTLYPEGVPIAVNVRFRGLRLDGGRMAMLCEAAGEAQDAPDSLRSVDALLHTAVMVTLYDDSGIPLYRNPSARRSVRASDQTLQAHLGSELRFQRLRDALSKHGEASLTLAVETRAGERWHELSARACRDPATGSAAWLVSEVDVTQLKDSEAQASFLALHDTVTGLPNRSYARQHFASAQGGPAPTSALLLIDLDEFKTVNDSLGHAAGDELLAEVAQRLRAAIRREDLVTRFGGDEFLVLLAGLPEAQDLLDVEAAIRTALSAPFALKGQTLRVTVSIGVGLHPRDGEDFDTLLRSADLALYAAKQSGRNTLARYSASMGVELKARAELEHDLREAVAQSAFEVHYQPILRVEDQRIIGAEALVRWRHPKRGLTGPDAFIPTCERLGLIRALDRIVLLQAARQRAAWAAAGHALTVSVNMSPQEFSEPDVIADLAAVLRQTGCDPAGLQIEITESTLLGSDEQPLETLRAMSALGLSVALDDFGTGYSNLATLRRYPIRTLKIDRSFIRGLPDDSALTDLIVELCRLMELRAVAEGVETPAQLEWIRSRGVEAYQGFLYAPALSAEAFSLRLQAQASER